jgi:Domain of unknown function (DUF397)
MFDLPGFQEKLGSRRTRSSCLLVKRFGGGMERRCRLLMSHLEAELQPTDWRKALRSIGNGDCVEIAPTNGQIAVRDSKDPFGPILRYRASTWQSFLAEARQGGLDRLSQI